MATDKFEIDLAVRQERFYRDMHRWENLRKMWHSDTQQTRVSISVITGTVEDWIAACKKILPANDEAGVVGPFHTMQPSEILLNDDRALATTLIGIHVRFPYKGLVFELESWAHQQQRFLKVSNESGAPEWKLVRFESIYIRDGVSLPYPQPNGQEVLDQAAKNIAALTHRTSFKCLAWQMSLAGARVSDDFPGYDDEKTWRPLVERNKKWLATGEDDSA